MVLFIHLFRYRGPRRTHLPSCAAGANFIMRTQKPRPSSFQHRRTASDTPRALRRVSAQEAQHLGALHELYYDAQMRRPGVVGSRRHFGESCAR